METNKSAHSVYHGLDYPVGSENERLRTAEHESFQEP